MIKFIAHCTLHIARFILNFIQVYVYLLIIKYYSICLLKIYSNSFLNLLKFNLEKAFIYLNVFINIRLLINI